VGLVEPEHGGLVGIDRRERVAVAHASEQVHNAGGGGRTRRAGDHVGIDPQCARDLLGRHLTAVLERGLRHRREAVLDVDGRRPRAGLEHVAPRPDPAEPLEQDRRADHRMAGQWQLGPRREDPQLVRAAEHEHGLRQPELGRDRLHLLVAQPVRVGQHGHRVPGERHIREHVQPVNGELGHDRL
jgi:hypothetical protein